MPSKGSKIITFRIPEDLDYKMLTAIERGNMFRSGEPWTQTRFIIAAIQEKLAHLDRSSGRKRSKKNPSDGRPAVKEE